MTGIGFTVALLTALAATINTAGAQARDTYDPFRIPQSTVSSCSPIEKGELITTGVGFRFDLDDDTETGGGRTVGAEFDSTGSLLSLVVVGGIDVNNENSIPQATILRMRPDGVLSVMNLRAKEGSDSVSPPASPVATEVVAHARLFAAWLWSHRCAGA